MVPTRPSKAIINFITDKIEEGEVLRLICQKYAGQVPAEKTIYRWKKKYPEVKLALDGAYQTYFYKKLDEIEMLSEEYKETEKKIAQSLKDGDKKEFTQLIMAARNHRDNVKMRLDALKFLLDKIAKKVVPDLQDTRVDKAQPVSVTVINYKDKSE